MQESDEDDDIKDSAADGSSSFSEFSEEDEDHPSRSGMLVSSLNTVSACECVFRFSEWCCMLAILIIL